MKEATVDHTTMGNNSLRCLNCGDEVLLPMPLGVYTLTSMMRGFNKDHAACEPSPAGRARFEYKTPEEWIRSWDTGESSIAIWVFMMGRSARDVPLDPEAVPQDPGDFGRCYRMLKAFPEWRARLPELGAARAVWAPFVARWAELESLFEEESPSGRCPKLYDALRACRPETR